MSPVWGPSLDMEVNGGGSDGLRGTWTEFLQKSSILWEACQWSYQVRSDRKGPGMAEQLLASAPVQPVRPCLPWLRWPDAPGLSKSFHR